MGHETENKCYYLCYLVQQSGTVLSNYYILTHYKRLKALGSTFFSQAFYNYSDQCSNTFVQLAGLLAAVGGGLGEQSRDLSHRSGSSHSAPQATF